MQERKDVLFQDSLDLLYLVKKCVLPRLPRFVLKGSSAICFVSRAEPLTGVRPRSRQVVFSM